MTEGTSGTESSGTTKPKRILLGSTDPPPNSRRMGSSSNPSSRSSALRNCLVCLCDCCSFRCAVTAFITIFLVYYFFDGGSSPTISQRRRFGGRSLGLQDDNIQEEMHESFRDSRKKDELKDGNIADGINESGGRGGRLKANKGLPLSGGLAGRKSLMDADKIGQDNLNSATASLVNKGIVAGDMRPLEVPKGEHKPEEGERVVARPKLDDLIDTKFKGKKNNQTALERLRDEARVRKKEMDDTAKEVIANKDGDKSLGDDNDKNSNLRKAVSFGDIKVRTVRPDREMMLRDAKKDEEKTSKRSAGLEAAKINEEDDTEKKIDGDIVEDRAFGKKFGRRKKNMTSTFDNVEVLGRQGEKILKNRDRASKVENSQVNVPMAKSVTQGRHLALKKLFNNLKDKSGDANAKDGEDDDEKEMVSEASDDQIVTKAKHESNNNNKVLHKVGVDLAETI